VDDGVGAGRGLVVRSATIEIMNHREKAIGQGRFGTDLDGYQAMSPAGRKHTDRVRVGEGQRVRRSDSAGGDRHGRR
jgi:hypothetical protein